jgi:hypothetical protein
MYTIYVSIIVGLLIACGRCTRMAKKERAVGNQISTFAMIEQSVVALFICGIIGVLTASGLRELIPNKRFEVGPAILVSMRSSDQIAGSFVHGSGTMGGAMTYHFYIRNRDDKGTISPRQISASSNIKIDQDPSLKEIGYWTSIVQAKDNSHWLSPWAFVSDRPEVVEQHLRVPAGSLTLDFASK